MYIFEVDEQEEQYDHTYPLHCCRCHLIAKMARHRRYHLLPPTGTALH